MLQGKKILVTGLTGNLGGSIAAGLVEANDVWGFARYSRPGQLDYWRKTGVRTVVGDCAEGRFEGLPDDFDFVVHSAANTSPATFQDGMRDNAVGSALLMRHCRKAQAFMHISAAGIYATYPEPEHWYFEGDRVGNGSIGHYTGTKLAAEGAVQAMAVQLNLPTIICRLGVQYGQYRMGGLPGMFMNLVLHGQPVALPARQHNKHMLISDDDVVRFIGPTLAAARVPAVTVNYASDEATSSMELIEHLGELAGKPARYVMSDQLDYPCVLMDPTLRRSITGPCQVPWREGVARMFHALKDTPMMRAPMAGSSVIEP